MHNLDFEKLFKSDPEIEFEHMERKNLGMTFVLMLRKKSKVESEPIAEVNSEEKAGENL